MAEVGVERGVVYVWFPELNKKLVLKLGYELPSMDTDPVMRTAMLDLLENASNKFGLQGVTNMLAPTVKWEVLNV